MWCEPEFHRAGHGKMFMKHDKGEGLSPKLVDLEDAEESRADSEESPGLSIRAGKPYPKSALDHQWGLHPADEAGCFPVPQVKGYCIV